ncbi:MAG: SH3 domain-containing protein [Myxococcota bacterium]
MLPLLLASLASAATVHDLSHDYDLPEGTVTWTAGALVNLRASLATDAPVIRRLPAGTRVTVVEQYGDRVEVRMGSTTGFVSRELLSTMGRIADLDGDGVEERIVVARNADGHSVTWLREGEHVQRLTIVPYEDPYLGEWSLVTAEVAGVPLLRVALGQDSCGSYPTSWLSYQDGKLREAIGIVEWTDGAWGGSAEVRFEAPGTAIVHQESHGEDGEVVASTELTCALREGTFSCS